MKSSTAKILISVVIIISVIVIFVVVLSFIEPRVAVSFFNGAVRLRGKRKPFYDVEEMYAIYPAAKEMEMKWKKIQTEFINAQQQLRIPGVEKIDPGQGIIAKNEDWKAAVIQSFQAFNDENAKLFPTIADIVKRNLHNTVSYFIRSLNQEKEYLHILDILVEFLVIIWESSFQKIAKIALLQWTTLIIVGRKGLELCLMIYTVMKYTIIRMKLELFYSLM